MIPFPYVLRRRMMVPSIAARLPKEFQETEYIQSSGTQYINTVVKASSNLRVEMKAQMDANSINTPFLFGARNSGTVASFCMFYISSGNAWHCDYQTSANRYKFDSSVVTKTGILEIDANKNVWTVNGITKTFSAVSFQSSYNLYLFAINNGGTVADYMPGKIFYCRLHDSDILVRDFVPCYRKSDKVAGFYDLVSGTFFGNAGTGSFVAGPDVGGTTTPPSGDFSFTYSGNYTDNRINGKGTVRLNTSGVFEVLSGKATVSAYILGAGGGAAYKDSTSRYKYGGGGGGNQTVEVMLTPGTYEIVIGTGGEGQYGTTGDYPEGGDGGNTSAFGSSSTGGTGGSIYSGVGKGGSPNGYDGGFSTGAGDVAGGSPNGGGVVNGVAQDGGDGYVEITFP